MRTVPQIMECLKATQFPTEAECRGDGSFQPADLLKHSKSLKEFAWPMSSMQGCRDQMTLEVQRSNGRSKHRGCLLLWTQVDLQIWVRTTQQPVEEIRRGTAVRCQVAIWEVIEWSRELCSSRESEVCFEARLLDPNRRKMTSEKAQYKSQPSGGNNPVNSQESKRCV